mgnify:CR=1 FL=1
MFTAFSFTHAQFIVINHINTKPRAIGFQIVVAYLTPYVSGAIVLSYHWLAYSQINSINWYLIYLQFALFSF